mmetsp:Transcript_10483/g.7822  ORF Transcript_10483/g.7822 Transcript_10483/m.7822 type:complete len:158 (-) Transcript_10483:138-611(-)|eukprot:CAMPEP_0202971150 /NCGR_PEP_ID=MMETSP1396-20130829/24452_1 /ASSEMBLY_ACC=CAM_ASM_000872 /TAXON_ID= /ORGANISM="Pseudokeronopsis sp., Strain Brazil" /LENGTH=157 /DNA_ID=CAMNT_0049700249 /DNA_START=55 /DNA_END=528 /DNA_ORIENTATION=+
MPRGSSRSSSRSAPAPSHRAPPAPAPAHSARAAPPPAAAPAPAPAPMQMAPPQQSGGLLGGLGRTVAEGFAFGAGSAVARNVVNSVMGGGSSAPAPAAAAPAPAAPAPPVQQQQFAGPKGCETDHAEFMRCLQENPTNSGNCDFYFNALQQCQARSF